MALDERKTPKRLQEILRARREWIEFYFSSRL
jgi:hypothetical protein